MARAAADGDNLPGVSAAVGGGDNDDRRGQTLTGKGRGPARQQRHAIKLIFTKIVLLSSMGLEKMMMK